MSTPVLILLALLAVLVLTAAAVIAAYNTFARLVNACESAWSDVDVQLRRRWELVPNLAEAVRGYAEHEQKTLSAVSQARGAAMDANGPEARGAAEGELSRVLRSLLAVVEAYPDLEANEGFLALQKQLSELEETIQNARRYYNALVRDLNTRCDTFPTNLVAAIFGFAKRSFFELDGAEERKAPRVSFAS